MSSLLDNKYYMTMQSANCSPKKHMYKANNNCGCGSIENNNQEVKPMDAGSEYASVDSIGGGVTNTGFMQTMQTMPTMQSMPTFTPNITNPTIQTMPTIPTMSTFAPNQTMPTQEPELPTLPTFPTFPVVPTNPSYPSYPQTLPSIEIPQPVNATWDILIKLICIIIVICILFFIMRYIFMRNY